MRSLLCGLILLGPLALLNAPAAAQDWGSTIEISAGLNLADFYGDDADGADTRTSFQAGGSASFPFSRSFAVQIGLGYSRQGTTADVGGGTTLTFMLDYIQVPVLLKLSAPLATNRSLSPYLNLGPVVGFQTKCNVKAAGGGVPTTELACDDPNLQLDTKSVDVSVALGVGLDIGRASLGLRYQLGLTSIDDSDSNADLKNRVLAILAGYRFRLGL